jgi:hypothetical protein
MYLQYFVGYSSFSTEPVFDPSLFVEIRKRLGNTEMGQINQEIVSLFHQSQPSNLKNESEKNLPDDRLSNQDTDKETNVSGAPGQIISSAHEGSHKGRLLVDATVCPHDIAYPTDLNLLNDARIKSEELIDLLYRSEIEQSKPRTHREQARKNYLRFAKSKQLSRKQIRKAVAVQLRYLRRNLGHIHRLLDGYSTIPLKPKEYKYLLVIEKLYRQQLQMWQNRTHSIEHRMVSIHQPHVRPIVR